MDALMEKGKQAIKSVRRYSKEFFQPSTAFNDVIEYVKKNYGDEIAFDHVLESLKQLDIKGLDEEAAKLFDEFDTEKIKKITCDAFTKLLNQLMDIAKKDTKK